MRRARPLLGTYVEIEANGAADLERAVSAAFEAVARVHRLMSFHDAGSDVSRLNRRAACEPVSVDRWTATVLRQARRVFTERLDHFAPRLGVMWRKLALSNAGTRWGTAHSDGLIRLNWRLIHFRLPVIDYVVAHELSHLRVMDHSPRFWDTVGTVVPEYAELRRQLKEEALAPW